MYHRLLLLFTYLSPVEFQFPVKSSHEVRGNKLVLECLVVHLVVMMVEVNAKEKLTRDMVIKSPPQSQDRRWPWGSDGLSPTEAPTSPQLPQCGSPRR